MNSPRMIFKRRGIHALSLPSLLLLIVMEPLAARETRLVIQSRQAHSQTGGAAGEYVRLSGRFHGELGPVHPLSEIINGIGLAPLINCPDFHTQKQRIDAHARPALMMAGMLLVLAEAAKTAGVPAVRVAQAAVLSQMTTGLPVSPLTPVTLLIVGLTGVELAAHQKFPIPLRNTIAASPTPTSEFRQPPAGRAGTPIEGACTLSTARRMSWKVIPVVHRRHRIRSKFGSTGASKDSAITCSSRSWTGQGKATIVLRRELPGEDALRVERQQVQAQPIACGNTTSR